MEHTVQADPARDVRDEVAERAGVVEFPDKIWFHKTAAAVIETDRCVGCAGCIAACPSGSIGVDEEGRPTLVRMCTGCSRCWDFCPLAGLRTERLLELGTGNGNRPYATGLGPVRAAYYARARSRPDGAQDGGVVTAILTELLEANAIDGAIVNRPRDAFRGETVLATTAEEVRAAAGSVYDQSLPLSVLSRPLPPGVDSVAMVGTPCQLNVLQALQRYPWPYRRPSVDAVTLTIGLFCTRSFQPLRLRSLLRQRGIPVRKVTKVDVRDGELTVQLDGGERIVAGPAAEFSSAALPGCDECADFSARLCDLSVGNCGSPPGYTSVIVRTEAGEAAWQAAAGALEWQPLADLEPVLGVERRNRRRALRHLRRDYAPEGSLWIPYSEHLRAYAGSDRAPVAPPAHRSHHYRISC